MASALSAPRAGSAGRGAAGAGGRTVSTARGGSGAREPFSGADTLRVRARGRPALGRGNDLDRLGPRRGRRGFGPERRADLRRGPGASGAGRGRRGPGRRGRGHDDRRRGRHGHARLPPRARAPGRARPAPGVLGRGRARDPLGWRGCLRGAPDLWCGAHRAPRALVHEQLDTPGEATPMVELVGHLDLAAGPDVLEPAVLGADGDPRGLGHHQRHHAAAERAGVDVDGVGLRPSTPSPPSHRRAGRRPGVNA